MVGIYQIRNILNNKCYYGSSNNISKRWLRHKNELRKNKHINIVLQRAWNKYGENVFIFEIVEECSITLLKELEQKYLNTKPAYNIGITANGGDNITHNPKRKSIIDKIRSGTKIAFSKLTSEEKIIKFSKPKEKNPNWKGGKTYCSCGGKKTHTANTCHKCRNRNGVNNPFFGKKHTRKVKDKLKQIAKNRVYKPSNSRQVSVDNVIYASGGEVAKTFNISRGLVNYRCKSKKYNWFFVE